MRYFWMLFLTPLAIAIITTVFVYVQKTRKKTRDISKMAVIAHTKVIKELPAYKAAERHYHILLALAVICLITTLFSTTVLASRPIKGELGKSRSESRDIMLCIDVSDSFRTHLDSVLKYYQSIISKLKGERIGLTIFDGKPINVIPLSDDYESFSDLADNITLSEYREALQTNDGTSYIGYGLIGCVNSFDKLGDTERPQSIILATDDLPAANDVSLTQAANYAKSYGITVYGILIGDNNASAFTKAITSTSGIVYKFNQANPDESAESIVKKISAQEAAIYEGASEYTYSDAPEIWLAISAVSTIVFMIVVWRLRL